MHPTTEIRSQPRRTGLSLWLGLLAACGLSADAAAQLSDLQPGANFPLATTVFAAGRTAAVDLGDVDNDGDVDVGFANATEGQPELNALHINQGGAQGGTEGSFTDESSTRFAGLPADSSRDLAFFDMEDDGDLDLFIANRGTTVNNGEVSRVYRNLGGLQQGAIGFFDEATDDFWGALASIPLTSEEGVQDGQGPWRGFIRSCRFADLDDDGDVDLFAASAGVNFNGTRESRIFLNDGAGRFDELFPWADSAADIKLHTAYSQIADIDGDYDLDIFVASRDSQSRLYRNESAQGFRGNRLFTDVTQEQLIDSGAEQNSSTTYGVDLGDLDGDGDFDAYMVNYRGPFTFSGQNIDDLLFNDGSGAFARAAINPIVGDPSIDERNPQFLDYDADGDLDVHVSSWLGRNRLYQNALQQPLPGDSRLLFRTGGSTEAPLDELPPTGNSQQTIDGAVADADGDGDPDLFWANDAGQDNRYSENALGIPDPFAPSFLQFTDQTDKADGTPTVIHAELRDNSSIDVVRRYPTQLIYSVDGGLETCVPMLAQGGMTFRAVLPAELEGTVAYRVETVDEAGNVGVSDTRSFVQSNPGLTPVALLGCGTSGVYGVPEFSVSGALLAGAPTQFKLRRAAPNAFAVLFLALQSTPTPFKQGLLYPVPVDFFLNRSTDAGGLEAFELPWPAFPGGLELWMQYGVSDASVPGAGASLSNAVKLRAP